MTEYWKSQAKKYCDFCKCWIADNAPNVSFHVNGWKHKENVKNKISEMTKKSQKEYKNQQQVDDEIKKMEEAGMKAYLKDIEASADLTSKVIQEELAERQKASAAEDPEEAEKEEVEDDEEKAPSVPEDKKWYEAKSDKGYTYYWHVDSGESRWEPPEEGYVSVAEQQAEEERQQKRQQKRQAAEARKKKAEDERRTKEQAEEERARKEREKMKSLRKPEEKPEESAPDASAMVMGPAPRIDPYGGWTVVNNRRQQLVDLQLPAQDFVAVKVPVVVPVEEPRIRFKEKTVSGLGKDFDTDGQAVGFKKRKFGANTKKNARQRLDDD